jgi:hypothetical protein
MEPCLFALGSICQFDSAATASWVQAVGSVGAILFAWAIGQRDGRLRRAREVTEDRRAAEARYGWLSYARASITQAQGAVRRAELNAADPVIGAAQADRELAVIATELAAIPPDKLGHARAITMVVETRGAVAMARTQLEARRRSMEGEMWAIVKSTTSASQAEIVRICVEEGQKLGY